MTPGEPRPDISHLSPRPAYSASGIPSEDMRRFLQGRLALLGTAGLFIAVGLLVVSNVIWLTLAGHPINEVFGRAANVPISISAVTFLLVTIICRRRAALSPRVLFCVDAAAILAIGAGCSIQYPGDIAVQTGPFISVMAVTNVLLLRAVTVPSTARRTLIVGLLAIQPAVNAPFVFPHVAAALGGSLAFKVAILWIWSIIAVVISTLTSNVIYGLREKVSEARQLGQYRLEGRIGRGGMGEVYRARHALLRRPTAIKLLRPEMAGGESLARFEREVQLTARLTHPNTISIFDYGHTPDGVFYYAMELIDGVELESLVQIDGPLPAARVIHVVRQICGSLSEAHEIGLIHRDIKPANVMLCTRGGRHDVAKVLDFGLVRELGDGPGITRTGAVAGTPRYMAPEAIASPGRIDARSDLYAVGAVAYFLAAGRPVFDGDDAFEICRQHIEAAPVKPSERVDHGVPADLEGVIMSALSKQPSERPQSASELDRLLAACGDAGGWTEDAATAWWQDRGRLFVDAGSGPEPSGEGTVVIDLGGRDDSGRKGPVVVAGASDREA